MNPIIFDLLELDLLFPLYRTLAKSQLHQDTMTLPDRIIGERGLCQPYNKCLTKMSAEASTAIIPRPTQSKKGKLVTIMSSAIATKIPPYTLQMEYIIVQSLTLHVLPFTSASSMSSIFRLLSYDQVSFDAVEIFLFERANLALFRPFILCNSLKVFYSWRFLCSSLMKCNYV